MKLRLPRVVGRLSLRCNMALIECTSGPLAVPIDLFSIARAIVVFNETSTVQFSVKSGVRRTISVRTRLEAIGSRPSCIAGYLLKRFVVEWRRFELNIEQTRVLLWNEVLMYKELSVVVSVGEDVASRMPRKCKYSALCVRDPSRGQLSLSVTNEVLKLTLSVSSAFSFPTGLDFCLQLQ